MRLLIDGAMVWNGTGAPPFPGKVLIEGERIISVAPQSEALAADGADRIDAAGKFLMPGMVEGHAHLSFVDVLIEAQPIKPARPRNSTNSLTVVATVGMGALVTL